jgi:hypothetical protein
MSMRVTVSMCASFPQILFVPCMLTAGLIAALAASTPIAPPSTTTAANDVARSRLVRKKCPARCRA